MAFDYYQVEILHYLNPNLIWVEVVNKVRKSEDIVFEQLGLYGILPMNAVIDVVSGLNMERSDEWMPAAAVVMKILLENADETWFSLIHVDRRSSIFDNNIHKYGEIVIKKNGRELCLSKELVEAGVATENQCQFHQDLSLGKIKTKLTNIQTKSVINSLEDYYKKSSKPKTLWRDSVKKNTSIFQTGLHLQTLTVKNLERYNNRQNIMLLENKLKDLEQCKGLDEESLGRGVLRESIDKSNKISDKKLRNKLELVTKKRSDTAAAIDTTKEYFRVYGHKKDLENEFGSDDDGDDDVSVVDTTKSSNVTPDSNEITEKDVIDDAKETSPIVTTRKTHNVVYGPPNTDKNKLTQKKATENVTKKPPVEELEETSKAISEVDSHIVLDFKNVDKSSDVEKKDSAINNEIKNEFKDKVNNSNNNITKSNLLQTKMKLFAKLNNSADSNTSETSTKSSLNSSRVLDKDNDSDEDMSEIIKNLKMYLAKSEKPQKTTATVTPEIKINVNPFRNIDGSNSVFVDKLVRPVLLVHTKHNNKIQPCSILRDVPFGTNTHVGLRNLGIKHPTRLQTVSWGIILRGFSAFLISPPKSGKTLGYLPAVCRLVSDFKKENLSSAPKAIIICATSRSVSEVEMYSKLLLGLEEKVFACYSGMDNLNITTALLNGCDLLICTPLMLVRLLQNDLGVELKELSTLVLDDCERISEVYTNEIKYILYEIKNMLKTRVHKRKVQIIVASRIWCDFLEPLALKAPDSVVCIGSFQEIILYSKTSMTVDFLKADNKMTAVLEFVDSIKGPNRTVIVCRENDEVKALETLLRHNKRIVFSCDNTMDIHDLYHLNVAWGSYEEPTLGPILVCCDSNLVHLNVTDANYLLHYSLPPLFSTFCRRFATLNDQYPSIFNDESRDLKVKVLLDDSNVEQLPKILNFIKRCTDNVPKTLDEVSDKILIQKDLKRVEDLVPLCDHLLSFGDCPDFWNCYERHRIFKDCDAPAEWIPKSGVVTFQILYFHSAVTYSARLLSCTTDGETKKYPQSYSTLSLKMGLYFSKETSKRLHGVPKLGDVCAVSLKQNFFIRCQVVKIKNVYKNGNPNHVVIKLIDEEKFEQSRDINLYHLPDEFKEFKTYVVQVRLANIRPQDRDLTFSCLAQKKLEETIEKNDDLFMRGHVAMSLGNCVFVDTLEACQNLSFLNETVVRHNFKQELLNVHAIPNPDHLKVLGEMCEESGVIVRMVSKEVIPKSIAVLPPPRWAHLEEDLSSVFLASVEDMDKFFVRLVKFERCMKLLNQEISKYVADNLEQLQEVNVGDIVLAKAPEDSIYERARVDEIYSEDKVKCFFVDQGDRRDIAIRDLAPITEKIITQLPFQAIECRLIGIRPVGEEWTDFSVNWFCDNFFEVAIGVLKFLYVKYFTKDKAEWTGGYKYSVALVDTTSEKDIVANQLMIDLNLATEKLDEIGYLSEIKFNKRLSDEGSVENESDKESLVGSDNKIPLDKIFMKQPIRSVPLVDSDESDSDSWQINRPEDFKALFMPSRPDCPNLLPITTSETQKTIETKTSSDAELTAVTFSSKDLTSDIPKTINFDLKSSKPKITWRQNENSVMIKILIVGIEDYNLTIEDRALVFSANHNEVQYDFTLELYGVINAGKSRHANKGQYILVTMSKLMQRNWLSLTKDGDPKKWIVYDVDAIDASSDEEIEDDNLAEVIMNNYDQNVHSESEDEDFLGDVY